MVAEDYDSRWHRRLERDVESLMTAKVSTEVYATEREQMRKDIAANESAIDRFFAEQSRARLVAIWQLVSIFLALGTMVIAVIGLGG